MSILNDVNQVNSKWLTLVLRKGGHISDTSDAELVKVEPLSAGSAYSTNMYKVYLNAENFPETAILKLPIYGPVRQILDSIEAYRREVVFYNKLAEHIPVRIPTAYYSEYAADTKDMTLLLEDLAPLVSADQYIGLTKKQIEAAIGDLAKFHAWSAVSEDISRFADSFPHISSPKGLQGYQNLCQFMDMAWPAAVELMGEKIDPKVREFGANYSNYLPFFVEKFSKPTSIVHGELRAENLFFDHDGSLILIDFQSAIQGSGMCDVAYLISQSVATDVRRENEESLVRRYWQGLVAKGVQDYSLDEAWEQYRIAVAYNLFLPGAAFTAYEHSDEKAKALLEKMLSRASQTIMDNDSLALIKG